MLVVLKAMSGEILKSKQIDVLQRSTAKSRPTPARFAGATAPRAVALVVEDEDEDEDEDDEEDDEDDEEDGDHSLVSSPLSVSDPQPDTSHTQVTDSSFASEDSQESTSEPPSPSPAITGTEETDLLPALPVKNVTAALAAALAAASLEEENDDEEELEEGEITEVGEGEVGEENEEENEEENKDEDEDEVSTISCLVLREPF